MSSSRTISTIWFGVGRLPLSGVTYSRRTMGHIVPFFRLETHVLSRIAGSLEALPGVLGWASFGTLVLAILLLGHLVARETGRPDRGLTAMAAVGFSSVLGPAVLWYSASQALACGTVILAMLAALQLWRWAADFGRWSWACWR